MKQKGRQLLAFIMVFILVTFSINISPLKAEAATLSQQETEYIQNNKAVILSVEALTIGQGFVHEPIIIKNAEGHTVDEILYSVLGDRVSIPGAGYYLDKIEQADTGEVNIPEIISNMPSYKNQIAPSNSSNCGNEDFPALGEFSYSKQAGWLYSVNNVFPSKGMHDYVVKTGDVVRIQFTVYGYGADIGNQFEGNQSFALTCANKDKLLTIIAFMNLDKKAWFSISENQISYNKAENVLRDLIVLQEEVDQFQNILGNSDSVSFNELPMDNPQIQDPVKPPVNPENPDGPGYTGDDPEPGEIPADIPTSTEPTTDPSINPSTNPATNVSDSPSGSVNENPGSNENPNAGNNTSKNSKLNGLKLSSVKLVKGKKILLSWKRVKGSGGYQIYRKDSAKGKYKKIKTIKSDRTLKYTDTKVKKNKTYYYKVRAYKSTKGKTSTGPFSKVKKIKVSR